MSIPEHVKKLALDAVAHKDTTAMIRLYSNEGASPMPPKPASSGGGMSEQVRKLAMDAIRNKTTLAELKLIESNGQNLSPLPTPRVARCMVPFAPMQHRTIVKDDLER